MRRRRINQLYEPVLSVHIGGTKTKKLVYLLVANKPIRYKKGYSRIVYIGTTKIGILRVAYSASEKILKAVQMGYKGIRRFDAYVVWAKSKRGQQTKKGLKFWLLLERALLVSFRNHFGDKPLLNGTGHNMKVRHEFEVFNREAVDRILNRYN